MVDSAFTDLAFSRTESHDARKYRPTFSLACQWSETRTAGRRRTRSRRTSSSSILIIAILRSTSASCARNRRTRSGS